MVETLFALLVPLFIMVALFAALWSYSRKQRLKADTAWGDVAQRHGGTFTPKAGPWYRRTRKLEAYVDEAHVVVDHFVVSTGKSSTIYTRLQSTTPGSGKLRLEVFRKHALSGLSRALGFQDVSTGDAVFDEQFVVKANDEALARAWLTPETRRAIVNAAEYRFVIDNGMLVVTRGIVETDADKLDDAAKATAAVAKSGDRIHDNWQRFAASREGQAERDALGRLRIEVEGEGAPLRVSSEGVEGGDATHTRIEARVVGGKGEAYELDAEAEGLSAELRERLDHLTPLSITSDGERVTLVLPGLETSESRLREACDLASDLADQRSRRYR